MREILFLISAVSLALSALAWVTFLPTIGLLWVLGGLR